MNILKHLDLSAARLRSRAFSHWGVWKNGLKQVWFRGSENQFATLGKENPKLGCGKDAHDFLGSVSSATYLQQSNVLKAPEKLQSNPCTFFAYLSQSLACHHKAAALAITGSAAAATQEVWPRTASVAADKTSGASAKCHDAEKGANSLRKVLESWLKKVYRLWPLGCPRAMPAKTKHW